MLLGAFLRTLLTELDSKHGWSQIDVADGDSNRVEICRQSEERREARAEWLIW